MNVWVNSEYRICEKFELCKLRCTLLKTECAVTMQSELNKQPSQEFLLIFIASALFSVNNLLVREHPLVFFLIVKVKQIRKTLLAG